MIGETSLSLRDKKDIGLDPLEEYQIDFNKYKEFVRSRVFLTETIFLTDIELIYKKLYMLTTIAASLGKIDRMSDIENFYNECKNNLILSLDLCNLNYYNASKQILRSAIETFFRLALALEKYIVYRNNKENGIYGSTPSLKKLKQMQYTHGIGNMTSYVTNYFKDTPVNDLFSDLNSNYSSLSGNVHVNKRENFTPHKYLIDYVSVDEARSKQNLNEIEKSIDLMIMILYYFSFQLESEGVSFSKKDITQFSHSLDSTQKLDEIEKFFVKKRNEQIG